MSSQLVQSTDTSFPILLRENWRHWGSKHVAARKKEFGIWQEFTWQHHYKETRAICLGLASLGFGTSDKVAILGRSCPEWLWCELAVQTLRGEVLGPDPDQAPAAMEDLIISFQPRFAFAEDHEQVERLLKIRQYSPSIKRIIHWKVEDLDREDSVLVSLADLRKRGYDHERKHPEEFDQRLGEVKSTDIAMVFVNGQNGDPVSFTRVAHRSLLSSLEANSGLLGSQDWHTEYVVMASLGQPLEQVMGIAASLMTGQVLDFPEIPATAQSDLREISPHVVALPAKTWNEIASTIESNTRRGSWLKKGLLRLGLSIRLKLVDNTNGYRSATVLQRLALAAAGLAVVQKIRDRHGLNRARTTFSVGDGISPEAVRLLGAIGVRLQHPASTTGTDPIDRFLGVF